MYNHPDTNIQHKHCRHRRKFLFILYLKQQGNVKFVFVYQTHTIHALITVCQKCESFCHFMLVDMKKLFQLVSQFALLAEVNMYMSRSSINYPLMYVLICFSKADFAKKKDKMIFFQTSYFCYLTKIFP